MCDGGAIASVAALFPRPNHPRRPNTCSGTVIYLNRTAPPPPGLSQIEQIKALNAAVEAHTAGAEAVKTQLEELRQESRATPKRGTSLESAGGYRGTGEAMLGQAEQGLMVYMADQSKRGTPLIREDIEGSCATRPSSSGARWRQLASCTPSPPMCAP